MDGIIIITFSIQTITNNMKIIAKYIFVFDNSLSKTFLFVFCINIFLLIITLLYFTWKWLFCQVFKLPKGSLGAVGGHWDQICLDPFFRIYNKKSIESKNFLHSILFSYDYNQILPKGSKQIWSRRPPTAPNGPQRPPMVLFCICYLF